MPRDLGRRATGALLVTAGAILFASGTASAFCRTTTKKVPAGYDPTADGCITEGLPVYWANACISYDIQKDASVHVPYDAAASGIATAFAKWTSATCESNGVSGGRVSIDVRDFGPVACSEPQYNQFGPNQHVIIFRDENWPYMDDENTLALTTVTFATATGELYDADMEINTTTTPAITYSATVAPDGFDFESIVTHETGHFLGMAHATDIHATMYAHYTQGDTVMRLLTEDDINGICTIYPPSGLRSVGSSVGSGVGSAVVASTVQETSCDPTPRHGFTSLCDDAGASAGGCAVAPAGNGESSPPWPAAALGVGFMMVTCLIAGARRRPPPVD